MVAEFDGHCSYFLPAADTESRLPIFMHVLMTVICCELQSYYERLRAEADAENDSFNAGAAHSAAQMVRPNKSADRPKSAAAAEAARQVIDLSQHISHKTPQLSLLSRTQPAQEVAKQ